MKEGIHVAESRKGQRNQPKDKNVSTTQPDLSSATPSSSGAADYGVAGAYEKNIYYDYGKTGITRFGGFVYEEWLKELQGKRGVMTYREMRDNDAIIGAFLYAIKMIIRKVKWKVEPGGKTPKDVEVARFVEECRNDMCMSWNDIISEILTFLSFGWCYMELCYKKRFGDNTDEQLYSKYDDGRIGWKKWGIRAQETLWRWGFNTDGSITGMEQLSPPDYRATFIPMEKSILFRTESNKNNPEGRSILRNAYRSWYMKKNIEEIEAIGIERDLAGFPIMWLPEEIMAGGMPDATPEQSAAYSAYKNMITNINRNEQEGALLPLVYNDKGNKMYDLTLLASGATRRQFDTNQIIQRYEQRIAMTVLADFLMLGHERSGSYSLSSNKTSMFQSALLAIVDIISETINTQAIPRLIKLNDFGKLKDYPKIVHDDIEHVNLDELGNFIQRIAAAGAVSFGDIETENSLRNAAKMPMKAEDYFADSTDIDDLDDLDDFYLVDNTIENHAGTAPVSQPANAQPPNVTRNPNEKTNINPNSTALVGNKNANMVSATQNKINAINKQYKDDRKLFVATIKELREELAKEGKTL